MGKAPTETMNGLKHPAEEAADRLSNGDEFDIDQLTRADVKYVVLALAGDGLDWDEENIQEDIFDSDQSATVTFDELSALATFLAEERGGEE